MFAFITQYSAKRAIAAAGFILSFCAGAVAPAFAADTGSAAFPRPPAAQAPAYQAARPYKGICSSFLVRREAKNRFAQQMRGVPNSPRLLIKHFANIEETQATHGPESYDIDRRYCAATVIMNNGQSYDAIYAVARNQGFAGIGGLRVSFCAVGLDNWLVRDNDCRSLRAPQRSLY